MNRRLDGVINAVESEVYEKMVRVEAKHWWFAARRSILQEVLRSVAPPTPSRLLDMGCGTGMNLPLLSEYGQVTGFESDEWAVARAEERGVGEVLRGVLPDLSGLSTRSYDVITVLDVLEHVQDDLAALQALRRVMADGGQLILTVPAYRFLWSPHDDYHHHKRRYTAGRIRALLETAGFEVEYAGYMNVLLFPIACLGRLFSWALPGGAFLDEVAFALPPRPLNATLRFLFAAERHVIPRWRLPFGLSVLALARNQLRGRQPGNVG